LQKEKSDSARCHVKHSQSVEIAYLINGGVVSERRLSRAGEVRAAVTAFAMVAGLSLLAAAAVVVALVGAHRVVYGTAYMALWALVTLGAGTVAAFRAARRARGYSIGPHIDDDAFWSAKLPLVQRAAGGYVLRLAPGMTGRIEAGRAPVPVESLGAGVVDFRFTPNARAELTLGVSTFVIRNAPAGSAVPPLPAGTLRRFARKTLLPLQLAALASVLCGVPAGAHLSEADMKSAIPANATPWEVEKMLRGEAQTQASTLHKCFDVMPISCQRRGHVNVGVALTRQGEIRSHWIAGSTFGADCPVNQCFQDVVSTWFFEPLPEPMKVILPVQVLRTDRPLPYGPARAAADLERTKARSGATGIN
jgi:hypothetical protein